MIRRFVVRSLVVLAVLVVVVLVIADRLAESAASRAVSIKVRQAAQLGTNPTVDFHGFPFLTQAFRGDYTDVTLVTHGIHRGGVRLATVSAAFRGVHVSLSDALHGRVGDVPIDSGTGEVVLAYPDLDAHLTTRHATVGDVAGALRITSAAEISGHREQVAGAASVTVSGTVVVIAPLAGSLRTSAGPVPAALAAPLAQQLVIRVDTGTLPFGLRLAGVAVAPDGLHVTASARGLTIPVPADAATVG